MSTPTVRAASRSEVPSGTATGLPSMVRSIVLTSAIDSSLGLDLRRPSGRGGGAERTPLALDVRLELVAPFLNAGRDRDRARVRQHADRLASHVVADLEERVEVGQRALPRFDPLHDLRRPGCPFAALCALRAALVSVEPRQPRNLLDHALG